MKPTLYFLLSLLLFSILIPVNTGAEPAWYGRVSLPQLSFQIGLPLGADWWRNSETAQKINLNDAQRQQLEQIFMEHRASLMGLRSDVENEEKKLKALFIQDQSNDQQVLNQIDQLQGIRNRMEKEYATMTLGFRRVLTPEQWKTLEQIVADRIQMKMRERRRFEGRGVEEKLEERQKREKQAHPEEE